MVKQLAIHLEERNHFLQGIVYIAAQDMKSSNEFLMELLKNLRDQMSFEEIKKQNEHLREMDEKQKEIDKDSDQRRESKAKLVKFKPQDPD